MKFSCPAARPSIRGPISQRTCRTPGCRSPMREVVALADPPELRQLDGEMQQRTDDHADRQALDAHDRRDEDRGQDDREVVGKRRERQGSRSARSELRMPLTTAPIPMNTGLSSMIRVMRIVSSVVGASKPGVTIGTRAARRSPSAKLKPASAMTTRLMTLLARRHASRSCSRAR